jgi:hypothetical protein
MYSERGDPIRAGFPHSEIRGSAPICRLPAAYRRLSRPSSPIIAKASTTCTYSLDPITLLPLARRHESKSLAPSQRNKTFSRLCIPDQSSDRRHDAIHNPVSPHHAKHANNTPSRNENNFTFHPGLLKSSRCMPSSPKAHQSTARARLIAGPSWVRDAGGANRDRTDDLLLAKQALSQLSYGPACRW